MSICMGHVQRCKTGRTARRAVGRHTYYSIHDEPAWPAAFGRARLIILTQLARTTRPATNLGLAGLTSLPVARHDSDHMGYDCQDGMPTRSATPPGPYGPGPYGPCLLGRCACPTIWAFGLGLLETLGGEIAREERQLLPWSLGLSQGWEGRIFGLFWNKISPKCKKFNCQEGYFGLKILNFKSL